MEYTTPSSRSSWNQSPSIDLRVLVCGGRGYARRDLVWRFLDRLNAERGISALIHGAASGADTLAGEWAVARGVPEEPYPIMVGEGGFGRNARMLREAGVDMVVHFPGGNGTRDMVRRATADGVVVIGGLSSGWPWDSVQLDLL